ncbi:SURF1 family protein [Maritimibacter sp. UBA3975]|uniref:SURF1 family protein n=1 Tax=Maritimibacter sp. UBA3975 TaxID=1946833 RepID=UPI000C09B8EA|nr:SURF1 family protein [Maritimibacter sp. UBA3975]MAM60751.1 cytochrome oxidase biogenesis protein Surf1, facilitates heme A insertion [Maritimibacter sp.]|tara:strand:- start:11463 stop:12149 length:687 start_codon:yes stop_codon:yes gene_type:complete
MLKQVITAILLIAGLASFVSLGVWQLQRLEWKQGVLDEIEAQIAGEAGPLPSDPDPETDRYRPVAVTGTMGDDEIHVLVSSRDFGAGFRIIAPFTTETGRRILVDRGFVPTEMKTAARTTGPMEVEGNLHWPEERDSFTPDDDPDGNWWYARDVDKIAGALGTDPVLVIARSQTDPDVLPLPVTTEGIPNDHLEYAMTWFLMAVTWVVMTGFALWRIRRRNEKRVAGT